VGIVENGCKGGGIIPAGRPIRTKFGDLELHLPLCHQLSFHQSLADRRFDIIFVRDLTTKKYRLPVKWGKELITGQKVE
jgi:hypothetical protein